jgi:DNA-binding response OmpR family regulator
MEKKYRLLIAEGNPYVATILVETLKNDFAITVATTGQDAARLLIEGNRFDCVLTELELPFFSGLELTKLIRMSKLIGQTPIVVLSSAVDSVTRIACLEQGADSCMAKPFNPLEVRAKLNAVLRRSATVIDEQPVKRIVPVRLPQNATPFGRLKSRILSIIM